MGVCTSFNAAISDKSPYPNDLLQYKTRATNEGKEHPLSKSLQNLSPNLRLSILRTFLAFDVRWIFELREDFYYGTILNYKNRLKYLRRNVLFQFFGFFKNPLKKKEKRRKIYQLFSCFILDHEYTKYVPCGPQTKKIMYDNSDILRSISKDILCFGSFEEDESRSVNSSEISYGFGGIINLRTTRMNSIVKTKEELDRIQVFQKTRFDHENRLIQLYDWSNRNFPEQPDDTLIMKPFMDHEKDHHDHDDHEQDEYMLSNSEFLYLILKKRRKEIFSGLLHLGGERLTIIFFFGFWYRLINTEMIETLELFSDYSQYTLYYHNLRKYFCRYLSQVKNLKTLRIGDKPTIKRSSSESDWAFDMKKNDDDLSSHQNQFERFEYSGILQLEKLETLELFGTSFSSQSKFALPSLRFLKIDLVERLSKEIECSQDQTSARMFDLSKFTKGIGKIQKIYLNQLDFSNDSIIFGILLNENSFIRSLTIRKCSFSFHLFKFVEITRKNTPNLYHLFIEYSTKVIPKNMKQEIDEDVLMKIADQMAKMRKTKPTRKAIYSFEIDRMRIYEFLERRKEYEKYR